MGNLLGNAVKFTGEGGRIWLTLKREGQNAVLRVKDSGMGIAAELLPHVFDLFAQADKSLNRSDAGLGIGLALVKSLVEMHEGTVHAQRRTAAGERVHRAAAGAVNGADAD